MLVLLQLLLLLAQFASTTIICDLCRRNQDLPSLQQHLFGPVEFSFDPRRDNKLVPSELKLVQMHPFATKKGIFQRARLALARR